MSIQWTPMAFVYIAVMYDECNSGQDAVRNRSNVSIKEQHESS